jgi:hypothetical protein
MSIAEMYLIAWGVVATACAVYYHYRYWTVMKVAVGLGGMLCQLALKKATVTNEGGRVVFEDEDVIIKLGKIPQ